MYFGGLDSSVWLHTISPRAHVSLMLFSWPDRRVFARSAVVHASSSHTRTPPGAHSVVGHDGKVRSEHAADAPSSIDKRGYARVQHDPRRQFLKPHGPRLSSRRLADRSAPFCPVPLFPLRRSTHSCRPPMQLRSRARFSTSGRHYFLLLNFQMQRPLLRSNRAWTITAPRRACGHACWKAYRRSQTAV